MYSDVVCVHVPLYKTCPNSHFLTIALITFGIHQLTFQVFLTTIFVSVFTVILYSMSAVF